MTPDYNRAATKAAEILIENGISSAPVSPLPILKRLPGVLVVSFQEMSDSVGVGRRALMELFGEHSQDAVTTARVENGSLKYLVAYNQQLPFIMLQRGLARELGHIVLGHDGTKPEDIREEEALCFARNLICPRPLIHSVRQSGIRLTVEVLGNLTGCFETCLAAMRRQPATVVPAELNRQIRDNFMPYILNFFEFQRVVSRSDVSALADFGAYMEGYEE